MERCTITAYTDDTVSAAIRKRAAESGESIATVAGEMLAQAAVPEAPVVAKLERRGPSARVVIPAGMLADLEWEGVLAVRMSRSGHSIVISPMK